MCSPDVFTRESFRMVSDSYLTLFCTHPGFSLERCEVFIRLIPTICLTIPVPNSSRPLLSVHVCVCEDVWVRRVVCNQTLLRTKHSLHQGSRDTFNLNLNFNFLKCQSGFCSKSLSSSSVTVRGSI